MRATTNTTTIAVAMAANTSTASRIAASRRSVAWLCTDFVTASVVSVITCSAMSRVICIECSSSGLLTSATAGSDMIVILVTICCCRFLVSGEPAPSAALIPNSVEGSVPARVTIALRSCGSARSAPRVTRISCIVICPRAPTARLKPCTWVRICSLSTRTDASITFWAVNSSGA
ncbi:Uncharacterised protein [Mycobacterium tuberculosis]|nr:Uncharacterised protein [Mycobacterium tuberculosis]CFS34063.1 Uncharacterised protein [Mycobacterium tuberculosis]CFS34737.1 Uncharacterised protein [Mycobacterium tuberculosis]CFS61611.1 Uncharacterised protein [Mycobacterium tuberculosis]CNM92851.1 Uncharacterised protein [Mycobacterium tuberculosis]